MSICAKCVTLRKNMLLINKTVNTGNKTITPSFIKVWNAIFYRTCYAGKVPPVDVLKSKANQFSGERSLLFEDEKVQTILKRMTSINLDKTFEARKENLENPTYELLDDEEFKEKEKEAIKRAENLLRMPHVMSRRKPINVQLSHDKTEINHDPDGADFVFTDISMSKNFRTRAVIIRENATGILREATWDERDRMELMYWPQDGQQYEIVPMLQDEHLPRVLRELHHEYVLDLINIQCEPDSPDYHRVHRRVYDDLERQQKYDLLKSTRHFGGMVFYIVSNNKINKLITYYIRKNSYSDVKDLINLHMIVKPESETTKELQQRNIEQLSDEELIKEYLKLEGMHNLINVIEDKHGDDEVEQLNQWT